MTTWFCMKPGRCSRTLDNFKPVFERLLHSGHGRAVQYARVNSVEEYKDVILDMCLHNRAVDFFFEGTHALYVYEFLCLLPEPDFYVEEIPNCLAVAQDNQDAVHRFRLARLLAKDGHPDARARMYQHFRPGPEYGETIAIDFLEMDHLDGLHYVAAKILSPIADGLLLSRAQEQFGERIANELFAHPSAPNPDPRAELRKWSREASREEFLRAAERFQEAPEPSELPLFLTRPYPLHPAPLLELAQHRDAVKALTHITHPSVRALALELVATDSPNREFAAHLLFKNFEPGDSGIALNWFLAEADPRCRHILGIALRQQTDAHHIELYEHTSCSECRSYVVEDLLERDALPPEYRTECIYDANETTRSLAGS